MLSGIGKIYNFRKFAFPLKLSIQSVLAEANQFVLAVCKDSDDDTVEYCQALAKELPGLKLVYSVWLESKDEGKFNMRRLADLAINNVDNDWFISVDMDEVYRPGELTKLQKQLGVLAKDYPAATVNFVHHYIDPYHRIFGKLYDRSCRVGKKSMGWHSYDDGFGIEGKGNIFMSDVVCNHYGFVRPAKVGIEKELHFQETLYKPIHSNFPDPRLIEMYENKDIITSEEFYKKMMGEKDFVVAYKGSHFPGVEEWWRGLK